MIATLCDLVSAATDRKRLLTEAGAEREIAERANAAKDDFLAALSHELRTPLNPVLLLATAAAVDPDVPPALRADFDTIARNVLLEARLIDDLLDSTRIARGKLVLELVPVVVHDVLNAAIANVFEELKAKQLDLTIDLDPGHPSVQGDAMRLQQIFWNVLKNAVKFTPEGGKIAVRTAIEPSTRSILIHISDTGMGLTAAELVGIFDAFKQGDHAGKGGSKKFGGLGLGLAIARSLVELHAGSIRATSAGSGCGAEFIIELPLCGMEPSADSGTLPDVSSLPAAAPLCTGLRILLVEDHQPTRAALSHLLARRQHRVSTAGTLEEARERAKTENFDLLITDIGLPDGSGYELMAELNRDQKLKGIAVTGYGMDEDIARSTLAGFSAHLTKPVKMQSLDNAMSAAMNAPERA